LKQIYENQLNKFFFHDVFILNSNYADGVLTLALKDLIFIKDENGKERMLELAFMTVKGLNITEFNYTWSDTVTDDGEVIYRSFKRVTETNKQERFLSMLSEKIDKTNVYFYSVHKELFGYIFNIYTAGDTDMECIFTCDSVSIEWLEE